MRTHERHRYGSLPSLWALACLGLWTAAAPNTGAQEPPSRPVVDSPELASLGRYAIGVRTLTLVEHDAPDVLASGKDRTITVDLWYPAVPASGSKPELYSASLQTESPGPPVRFTVPGLAVRDAPRASGRFPLVVVSHGRSNPTIGLSWLTENLASKGYVIAAIRHEDLPRSNPAEIPEMLLRRPLDLAFVTRTLQATLAREGLIDPARTALIGYSMGGYAVLTGAGAALDPQGPACKLIPGGQLTPFAAGGARQNQLRVADLKAVVAIAPAGESQAVWGSAGLSAINAPLLLIAGDHDRTVDYATGARAIFEASHGRSPLPADLQARRPRTGLGSRPAGDAPQRVGHQLVRGSGVAQGAHHRHQPAHDHRVSRSVRQGR